MDTRSVLCKILLMVVSRSFSTSSAVPAFSSYDSLFGTRAQLQERLTEYVQDTLSYIETVRDFCNQEQEWTSEREAELKKMRDISENQQEKELGDILTHTLEGLKKLEPFLDAVEKLAVTSTHVFSKQIFRLCGENPEGVKPVIEDARIDARRLIHFKRNPTTFFKPLLDNVNVLIFQLNNYKLNTEQLCDRMRRSVLNGDIYKCKSGQPLVCLIWNTRKNNKNQMLDHLNQLYEIRTNEHTRLAFLFQEKNAQKFIKVFNQRRSNMWQLLKDLEDTAVHLDRMKKGASISTVAGSSVGIVGGVLSLLGIVLVPVTAGTSLGLTVAGATLGGLSAVDGLVTDSTEIALNSQYEHDAKSYMKSYMDDTIEIEDCLKEAINNEGPLVKPSSADAGKITHLTREALRTTVNVFEGFAAITLDKSERGIQAVMVDLETVHLSSTQQLAKAKMLKTVSAVRRISGVLNFLCIGLDGYSIYIESQSLAKGSESKVSKIIRSRVTLWRSELEAWEKMYNSLSIGKETINETQDALEKPFLP